MGQKRELEAQALNLLSCWHKLEHFSPASLPKGRNVRMLTDIPPWEAPPWKGPPRKLAKGKTIEYTLYLGVFNSSEVTDFVKKFFHDTTEDPNHRSSNICMASFKVDQQGLYIANSLGISTLPWALEQLNKKKIRYVDWGALFKKLQDDIRLRLEYVLTQPLSLEAVLSIQQEVIAALGWGKHLRTSIVYKEEEKSIRNDAEEKNNAELLNSFYVDDLERIIKKFSVKNSATPFLHYLQGCLNDSDSHRINLSEQTAVLKESLTPLNYPDGCWPSKYTLSLMQQYAVNSLVSRLADAHQGDILSVNGPPGTGKTTLLRDVIAAIIVKRAKILSGIEEPHTAFRKIGALNIEDNFKPFIYSLDQRLCQSGIVVASSNNTAVENISRELPLKSEVKDYEEAIGYFRSVAETCMDPTHWGILAAVMGKQENRQNLISRLWYNKQAGREDLKQSLNSLASKEEWEEAIQVFKQALRAVKEEKEQLEQDRKNYDAFIAYYKKYQVAAASLSAIQASLREISDKVAVVGDACDALTMKKNERLYKLERIRESKPGFFVSLLEKSIRQQYSHVYEQALAAFNDARQQLQEQEQWMEQLEAERHQLSEKLQKVSKQVTHYTEQCDALRQEVIRAQQALGHRYADDAYWKDIDSKETQEGCPWYSDTLKERQSQLFIAALKLQETFIRRANAGKAYRIRNTLAAFFSYLQGNSGEQTAEEIKAMWDVFFLVIPLISTTFASVQTMFKDLGPAALPWLFIDEAGQAIPQAAAGAIWRAQRVVVVGDPLQIEPVVTGPREVTRHLRTYFDLPPETVSPDWSVQSMADRINPLGMYLEIEDVDVWVGIPLRVHRRCLNPMFDIANTIAYSGSMILSTQEPKKVKIHFASEFIHQPGAVVGRHWVPAQGERIREIILDELHYGQALPDVFIITPFNEISKELRNLLREPLVQEVPKAGLEVSSEEINKWITTHIGTVHTFQGKQADAVILCLGLDDKTKGAVAWAAQKPNLLNVALTRAKYRFVAVGDEKVWLRARYFKELRGLEIKSKSNC